MNEGIKTVIHPVTDLARAKALFADFLGVEPYVDGEHYVGFRVGDQEIGLDPGGQDGAGGPVGYWHVDDIEASLRRLSDAGAEVNQEAKPVGGGRRIASVRDTDGNVIGLVQDS